MGVSFYWDPTVGPLRKWIIWVPTERDPERNCAADELARAGTTNPLHPEKEPVGNPLATCWDKCREYFNLVSLRKWSNLQTCRNSSLICPTHARKRSTRLIAPNRQDCSLAIKAITGHRLIGTHAARLSVQGLHKHNEGRDGCAPQILLPGSWA